MTTKCWNLIVITPESPGILKMRTTRAAAAVLFVAALTSLGIIFLLGYLLPTMVTDVAHRQLVVENERLKVANRNVRIQAARLTTELTELEQQTERIEELIAAD
jgi:hypothetical protein